MHASVFLGWSAEEKMMIKAGEYQLDFGLCCKLKRKGGKVSWTDEVLEGFLIIFPDLNAVCNGVLSPTRQEGLDPFSLLVFLYWLQWIYSVKEELYGCEPGLICVSASW